MKKMKIFSELAYILGMIFLSFGVIFTIKSDLGIAPLQTPAYIIYEALPYLSFGTYNYLFQLILVILLCIIIRKFNVKYILSFFSAVIYGFCLDGADFLLKNLYANSMYMKILFFAIGFFLIAFGVTFFFKTNLPLMPLDIFVKDFSSHKYLKISNVKIIFDISILCSGIILSLSIFKKLVGIGIGTFIRGFFSGITIKFLGKGMDRIFLFSPLIKYEKKQ